MSKHETCKDCKWNNYPICNGTIISTGINMRIDNLKSEFQCGVKNTDVIMNYSIGQQLDLEKKVQELESRIIELENKVIKE